MKTIFDQSTREELIRRIHSLNESSRAQWGKMNVYQMVKHCRIWEEMAHGRQQYKRAFLGRIFGKMALKNVLKDERPLARSTPTLPQLVIKDNGDISPEKNKWIALINEYEQYTHAHIMHPFFGKMTKEQVGYIAYKHSDHHLRQFNS